MPRTTGARRERKGERGEAEREVPVPVADGQANNLASWSITRGQSRLFGGARQCIISPGGRPKIKTIYFPLLPHRGGATVGGARSRRRAMQRRDKSDGQPSDGSVELAASKNESKMDGRTGFVPILSAAGLRFESIETGLDVRRPGPNHFLRSNRRRKYAYLSPEISQQAKLVTRLVRYLFFCKIARQLANEIFVRRLKLGIFIYFAKWQPRKHKTHYIANTQCIHEKQTK